jgi:cytochrome c biogenesis protein CcmG/thiol:disulfide interchange protein DsbE
VSRWFALVPAAALIGVVAVGGALLARGGDPHVSPDALVGQPLPASPVKDLDGGAVRPLTATLHGPALVNVFASWCAPCRVEAPMLMKLKADGVPVVGLAWKDKPEDTRSLLNELGDPYSAVVTDQGGRAGLDLGITGVPETFLVDAHGKVVAKRAMPLTDADAAALEGQWRSLGGR